MEIYHDKIFSVPLIVPSITAIGTYRWAICATDWYVSLSYLCHRLVRIAELFVPQIGTYRWAICGILWYVSQSFSFLWYVSQSYLCCVLVRIAELFGACFGTYRRAICGAYWYVSQSYIAPLGTYRRAILWRLLYVSQSYLFHFLVRIAELILVRFAELFVPLIGTYRRANWGCYTYRRA